MWLKMNLNFHSYEKVATNCLKTLSLEGKDQFTTCSHLQHSFQELTNQTQR